MRGPVIQITIVRRRRNEISGLVFLLLLLSFPEFLTQGLSEGKMNNKNQDSEKKKNSFHEFIVEKIETLFLS